MSADREAQPLSPAATAVAAFVAGSPLNIVMLDRDGRIVECSPMGFATAGVTREQFIGTRMQDLFESNTTRLREVLGSGDLATPVDIPLQSVRMPNGEVHWIQTTVSPSREDNGEIGGLVCVNSDMTLQQRSAWTRWPNAPPSGPVRTWASTTGSRASGPTWRRTP
jgi:PAS domain S-box-containing protein